PQTRERAASAPPQCKRRLHRRGRNRGMGRRAACGSSERSGLLLDSLFGAETFNEGQPEQVLDLRAVDLLGPAPLKILERLEHGEARVFDAPLDGAVLAQSGFAFDELRQISGIADRDGAEAAPVDLRALAGSKVQLEIDGLLGGPDAAH